MLMNGQKVNHLVVNGETFDKSYSAGVKAKVIKPYAAIGSIKAGGTIASVFADGGQQIKNLGDIVTVIGRYKNAAAILTYSDYISGCWISMDDIEFIDETGGVNSPFYLLLLYCCLILLAWEVAFLC